ncbi:MAG: hypothetical protein OK457_11185 [Thaumarchaeota archaeon]|nr:hypothetical protein [Nitrososphaerota archaeon]
MIDALTLYSGTTVFFTIGLIFLWYSRLLNTAKMVFLLFALDIALTVEAAIYSDVVLIALLHVVTIPAFFSLIYLDLVKQQSSEFRCFVCGKPALEAEEFQVAKRLVDGIRSDVIVHTACISLDQLERKAFSKNKFRRGIPE